MKKVDIIVLMIVALMLWVHRGDVYYTYVTWRSGALEQALMAPMMAANLEDSFVDFSAGYVQAPGLVREINESCSALYDAGDIMEYPTCVAEGADILLQSNDNVYDFNRDDSIDCKDYSMSFIYLMRSLHVRAAPAFTEGHMLVLVETSPNVWRLNDPSWYGFAWQNLDGYVYAKLA